MWCHTVRLNWQFLCWIVLPTCGSCRKRSHTRWRMVQKSVYFVWNSFIKLAALLLYNVNAEWGLTREKVQNDLQWSDYWQSAMFSGVCVDFSLSIMTFFVVQKQNWHFQTLSPLHCSTFCIFSEAKPHSELTLHSKNITNISIKISLCLTRNTSANTNTFFCSRLPLSSDYLPSLVITLFTTSVNIKQFYVLPTECIYVFCMDLRTNSDRFSIQH
jgi:hypothetical protein